MKPSTADMARYKGELEEQGYCLVRDALEPTQLKELRDTLVRVAANEIADGTDYLYEDGSNQRVWVLLNKGRCFEELVQNEIALELVGHLLGPLKVADLAIEDPPLEDILRQMFGKNGKEPEGETA